VLQVVIALGLSPALVALSTLAARRWGAVVGGAVSAFPAVVGPVLLIVAIDHGRAFAARAAGGTLLGLVALAAFGLAYGWAALRWTWSLSLVIGWLAACAAATATGLLADGAGSFTGLIVAISSLGIAAVALPADRRTAASRPIQAQSVSTPLSRHPVLMRMAVTVLLVAALSLAAGVVGPVIGGMLASLPVLASVLSVFAHRGAGTEALIGLLRGMLTGMAAFVTFCEVIALVIRGHGLVPAFLMATAAALIVQSLTLVALTRVSLRLTVRRWSRKRTIWWVSRPACVVRKPPPSSRSANDQRSGA
jgi:hypothetical protein